MSSGHSQKDIAKRSHYVYVWVWYCSECEDGPHSAELISGCPNCNHIRCQYCILEQIKTRKESVLPRSNTVSSPRRDTPLETTATSSSSRSKPQAAPSMEEDSTPYLPPKVTAARVDEIGHREANDPLAKSSDKLQPSSDTGKHTEKLLDVSGLSRKKAVRADSVRDKQRTKAAGANPEVIYTSAPKQDIGSLHRLDDIQSSSISTGIRNVDPQAADTKTTFAPATLAWREGKTTSQSDSSSSLILAPSSSEGSSLSSREDAKSREGTTATADEMERLKLLVRLRSEKSLSPIRNSRASSPDANITKTLEVIELRELPWFMQSIIRIWQWFLHIIIRMLQNLSLGDPSLRVRGSGHSGEQSESSGQQNQSSNDYRNDPGQRKRKSSIDPNNWSDPDGSSTVYKRKMLEESRTNRQPPFACPFSKKDLQTYQDCTQYNLSRVRDVKQHIHLKHDSEINTSTETRLRKKSSRTPEVQQWFEIFDILFPNHKPRPISPYKNYQVSEQLPFLHPASLSLINQPLEAPHSNLIPRDFIEGDGAEIVIREISAVATDSGLSQDTIRRAVNRGLFNMGLSYMFRSSMRSGQSPPQANQSQVLGRHNEPYGLGAQQGSNGYFQETQPHTTNATEEFEALTNRRSSATTSLTYDSHLQNYNNPESHPSPGYEDPSDGSYQGVGQDAYDRLPDDELSSEGPIFNDRPGHNAESEFEFLMDVLRSSSFPNENGHLAL